MFFDFVVTWTLLFCTRTRCTRQSCLSCDLFLYLHPSLMRHSLVCFLPFSMLVILQFTPQYGDSFLEKMRLLILLDMRAALQRAENSNSGSGPEVHVLAALDQVREMARGQSGHNGFVGPTAGSGPEPLSKRTRYTDLTRQCVNADPNYGVLWFFCKLVPFDPARRVLATAHQVLRQELANPSVGSVYMQAMLSRKRSSSDIVRPTSVQPNDFVTGLIAANRVSTMQGSASLKARLGHHGFIKLLYGSDEIRA